MEEMANESKTKNNDQELPEKKLRKQLAVAVRSIQWSYAIFWSLSQKEPVPGVLEWNEGYYNGDIKTRKTVQAMELKADKIGLQRSEQLRELYKSLLEDETNDQQSKKTSSSSSSSLSPALSPEDLSDAEWYYLVCMSFVFKPGQGLPGRALAIGQPVWLCDAQNADSKAFSRSLLAKSASIQTVVCFPHLGGVIEIGVTDQVSEDLNLLQHIKASLLDFSKPVCTEKSLHRTVDDDEDNDRDRLCAEIENLCSLPKDIRLDQRGNHEKYIIESPDECPTGCEHHHQTEDSFMTEFKESVSTKHCISEAVSDTKNDVSSPRHGNLNPVHLRELEKSNHVKLGSLDLEADDDLHYKRTVAAILGGSSPLSEQRCSCESGHGSSFVAWRRGLVDIYRPRKQQRILKKILLTVPLMYGGSGLESPNKDSKTDCIGVTEHGKSSEKENFLVLRSIVPSIHKTDQETVLNETFKYLKELEARVEELESCSSSVNRGKRATKRSLEILEEISDNCGNKKIDKARKAWMNKRKACFIDEKNPYHNDITHNGGLSLDLKVRIKDQEVLIDMKCPYKEYILLDIMDAINHLHLDSHSVQSSTLDGVFTLTLKSKFRGTAIAPVGMIKQALWKVAGKC